MKKMAVVLAFVLSGCAYHADPSHPPAAGLFATTVWCQDNGITPQTASEIAAVAATPRAEAQQNLVANAGLGGAALAALTMTPAEHRVDIDIEHDHETCLARRGWLRNE